VYGNVMDFKNSEKTKIKSDFKQAKPQLEKLTSIELILGENKQGLPENIADANRHSVICEALECYSKADTKVHLKVGTKGIIPLFLCTNCKSKLCLETTEGEIAEQENLVNEGKDYA
jgi:hypothetical protein